MSGAERPDPAFNAYANRRAFGRDKTIYVACVGWIILDAAVGSLGA